MFRAIYLLLRLAKYSDTPQHVGHRRKPNSAVGQVSDLSTITPCGAGHRPASATKPPRTHRFHHLGGPQGHLETARRTGIRLRRPRHTPQINSSRNGSPVISPYFTPSNSAAVEVKSICRTGRSVSPFGTAA